MAEDKKSAAVKMAIEKARASGDKAKALESAFAQIEKRFGKGAVMRLGDSEHLDVACISTGILGIDLATGIGGLPRGRIVEIYGPESSGKTTVALHAVAEAQKSGGEVAFIDAEHALDPSYAKNLGVEVDRLIISQPDTGEQALEITEYLVRSGAVDMIVVDSVAALTPKQEIDGEMGDAYVGSHARLMSQALRKITGLVNKSSACIIFINQLREKIGGNSYGTNEVTTGGRALKFYSSVRIDVRRIEAIKSGTELIGNKTRIRIVKNKVAPPFKEAEVDILYGEGISKVGNVLDIAVIFDIVTKSGSWFSYGGTRLGQGRDTARQYFKDHPEALDEVTEKIQEKIKSGATLPTAAKPPKGSKKKAAEVEEVDETPDEEELPDVEETPEFEETDNE